MIKLAAIFNKELKLLWRDKVGLIFLFILPMCLVLFITLTSTQDTNKPQQLKLLLINHDAGGAISTGLVQALTKIDGMEISESTTQKSLTEDNAKNAVIKGEYQALMIIPANFSKKIQTQFQQIRSRSMLANKSAGVIIQYDPALPKNFQNQIQAALQLLTQAIELGLWQHAAIQINTSSNLISIKSSYVQNAGKTNVPQPNDVQQNVPAWALFGMFFIITPLSGLLVKERRLGVMHRLWLAPVSLFSQVSGKIGAFVCINILQLVLMLAVGVFVLPWFGLPKLDVVSHPLAILMVGISASLAATCFGMLIGSLVRTPEQANVIGPFIIVIAAAIGGIFVPVYLLPEAFKKITHFSPMYWALQSFIDIFVRGANLSQLLPNIAKLLGFAAASFCLATLKLSHYRG